MRPDNRPKRRVTVYLSLETLGKLEALAEQSGNLPWGSIVSLAIVRLYNSDLPSAKSAAKKNKTNGQGEVR